MKSRSHWLPTEMTFENPMFWARLQSTTVLMMAPLWEMNAMLPGFGDWWT